MDLTKILKKGDKIYCTIYGYVNVAMVNKSSISVTNEHGGLVVSSNGKYNNNGECLIFPSKDNRDWSTWETSKECPFKPFDKVLMRDDNISEWRCGFFSHFNKKYCVSGLHWIQCIPYNKETEHLVGTIQECPDKYKKRGPVYKVPKRAVSQ
jgi:hypothetical protein